MNGTILKHDIIGTFNHKETFHRHCWNIGPTAISHSDIAFPIALILFASDVMLLCYVSLFHHGQNQKSGLGALDELHDDKCWDRFGKKPDTVHQEKTQLNKLLRKQKQQHHKLNNINTTSKTGGSETVGPKVNYENTPEGHKLYNIGGAKQKTTFIEKNVCTGNATKHEAKNYTSVGPKQM